MSTSEDFQPPPPPPSPPAAEPSPPPPVPPTSWARALLSNLRWRAHWLFPNAISSGYQDEVYKRTHDEEINAETTIPPGVDLRSTMIWGVELYGPAEIESLYESVDRLGWTGMGVVSAENSATRRIREQRANGPGGWINIGHVRPPGPSGSGVLTDNRAPLPEGVSSLSVRVFQLTSSLTAVIIGFALTDALRDRYAEEVNLARTTYRRRAVKQRAIHVIDPWHQKHDAVSRVRSDLRAMVGHWFAQYLPGYFSGLAQPALFPTMELLLLNGQLFEQPGAHHRMKDWQRLVVSSPEHDVWTYAGEPGLQLTFERLHDGPQSLHIIAAVDIAAFPKEKVRSFGGDNDDAYGWYFDHVLDGILLHGTTIEFLRLQFQDLSETRDRMKSARSARKHVARTLEEIGDFFDQTLGSSVIARELAKHSEDLAWYRHDCGKFWCPGWEPEQKHQIYERICQRVNASASQLSSEEDALRSHFEQLATVLSVRESIRTQWRMEWWTVAAIIMAGASLVVSLSPPKERKAWVESALDLARPTSAEGGRKI